MSVPKSVRLNKELELEVKLFLKQNNIKFSQLIQFALKNFINNPQSPAFIPVISKNMTTQTYIQTQQNVSTAKMPTNQQNAFSSNTFKIEEQTPTPQARPISQNTPTPQARLTPQNTPTSQARITPQNTSTSQATKVKPVPIEKTVPTQKVKKQETEYVPKDEHEQYYKPIDPTIFEERAKELVPQIPEEQVAQLTPNQIPQNTNPGDSGPGPGPNAASNNHEYEEEITEEYKDKLAMEKFLTLLKK